VQFLYQKWFVVLEMDKLMLEILKISSGGGGFNNFLLENSFLSLATQEKNFIRRPFL